MELVLKKYYWVNLLIVVLLSFNLACGTDSNKPKPPPPPAVKCGTLKANETCETLIRPDSFSAERYFILNVPDNIPSNPALFISLHGSGGRADRVADLYQFQNLVSDAGYIGAFANSIIRSDGISTWNAHDNSYAIPQIDDVQFISRLIDELVTSHNIDPDKVFVFGWSNGGFMANRLACEIPDKIAGIYTLAGHLRVPLNNCSTDGATAVSHLHPTGDPTVPFAGDAAKGYMSAGDAIGEWVNFHECDTNPETFGPFDLTSDEPAEESNSYRYSNCRANVEFTVIDGSDHGPEFQIDVFHNELISFFARSVE